MQGDRSAAGERLADEVPRVQQGSILYMLRGTPRTFTNHSGALAVAQAVYLPAFDGTNRVLIAP